MDPPCVGIWEIIEPSWPPDQYTFTITGINCFDPSTCQQNFVAYPTHVQMPSIIGAEINAIASPQKGMLTYDCEAEKLMLQNGEWYKAQKITWSLQIAQLLNLEPMPA